MKLLMTMTFAMNWATVDSCHKNRKTCKKTAEAAGSIFFQKIMLAQAVDAKSLLQLSTSDFKRLRIIFKQCFEYFTFRGKDEIV